MAKFTNLSQNFTMIPNWLINNQEISLKTKGLYIFLASKPDDFDFSAERISAMTKEGLSTIKSCLRQLEKIGLLDRKKIKNENNQFVGIEYFLQEIPVGYFSAGGKVTDINNKDNTNTQSIYNNTNDNISLFKEDILNTKVSILEREENFKNELQKYVPEFGAEMIYKFYLHWSEQNKSKTKLKFELEKTWDLHKRLLKWQSNNYGNTNFNTTRENTSTNFGYKPASIDREEVLRNISDRASNGDFATAYIKK